MPNKKDDLPAMPWYWGDWKKAPEIRVLDLPTRMVWFEMLGLMWESTERGYLTINGNPMTPEMISGALGVPLHGEHQGLRDGLTGALSTMKTYAVYSTRNDGAIYSRHMVQDQQRRKRSIEFGQKGGNPTLMGLTPALSHPENETEYEFENIDGFIIGYEDLGKDKKYKYFDLLIADFGREYHAEHGNGYVVIDIGKERSAIGALLRAYKAGFKSEGKESPDSKTTREHFKSLFRAANKIKDQWYHDNMTLSLLRSKLNEILRNIEHETGGSSQGRLDSEFFERLQRDGYIGS